MKRKAEKQETAAPVSAVSAIAARRARQQQRQAPAIIDSEPTVETGEGPPAKKSRPSPARETNGTSSRKLRQRAARKTSEVQSEPEAGRPDHELVQTTTDSLAEEEVEEDEINVTIGGEDSESELGQAEEGYESPSRIPAEVENFTLSKTPLNPSDVVYSDERTLCVRIKEKTNLVLIGVYDIWVKRGVVSLIGAKLPPSPKTYRVYAPSTHSLPVIKCVSGVDGYAEVEIQSCYSGIYRLDELSPLYNRVWNRGETIGDKATLKGRSRRTFSILHTSSDDPLKRPLRPLHLDKQWSATVKALSQRGRGLQALICGPKATGKSTFSRYLLNHLLSPAPQIEGEYGDLDGVAFLDLDPGQPEFSPMGEIYLAHLREPCFGPPFSHPTLENARQGSIVRAHHIGATSPKEDPDHYAMAVMNLMERYRTLRATFPRCPLIINFPGWIFGQGLEVAQWLIRSLGLSDVVYMSEKGPPEVVEPLGLAAGEARVSWTTLPSQPVDFVSRSSAQLRSMQMQSYFHISQPEGCQHPMWSESPLIYNKPILVSYAGPQQGILGVMVLGNQHDPSLLRDILDGSIVSIVAVEDLTAVVGPPSDGTGESGMDRAGSTEDDTSVAMDEDPESTRIESSSHRLKTLLNQSVTRSPRENLPYLFVGAGSCTPLDPKASRTFGLALVRGIHPSTRQLELVTPIPHSRIQEALQESQGLVLVRGHLDNPDWAISEDYHAARSAERKHAATVGLARESGGQQLGDADLERQRETSRRLRERVQRASKVPWMTVVEDQSSRQPRENRSLWKLRKKAYIGSDSDPDW